MVKYCFKVRCFDCGSIIQFEGNNPDEFECPVCEANQADKPPVDWSEGKAPAMISGKSRSIDKFYREQVEQDSADRAEEHGAPGMKMTDLRDNLREGDVAMPRREKNFIEKISEELQHSYYQPGSVASVSQNVADLPAQSRGDGSLALDAARLRRQGEI